MMNFLKRLLPLRVKLWIRRVALDVVGPASPDNQLNDITANLLWQELERARQNLHHKIDALEQKMLAGDDLVLNSVNIKQSTAEVSLLNEIRNLNERIDRLEASPAPQKAVNS